MQKTFFENDINQPLASRLRPKNLDEFVGQRHLIGENKVLGRLIENDSVPSLILWGRPGVGKTTLAHVIANETKSEFMNFSAVTSSIKEIKEVMINAEKNRKLGLKTIVFIDEIHRFNKAQQDAFLPYVEKGSIILIGATTENPSFEINSALLSRCKVFVLKSLDTDDLVILLKRAVKEFGNEKININDEFLTIIAKFANGDARSAISTLEMIILNSDITNSGVITITKETLEQCLSTKLLLYDKNGEEHYNIISALHKSMRNSDPDAAVYWLARMLEAGENPLFVARRVIRFASEDIGLADPHALELAVAVYQACHFIGMPECNVNLAQAVIYMSMAPKSNSIDTAYNLARCDAKEHIAEPVPLHMRNASTRLMKELNYGKDYKSAHEYEERITNMQCLPDTLINREYYYPSEQGLETKYKAKLEQIKSWKKEH